MLTELEATNNVICDACGGLRQRTLKGKLPQSIDENTRYPTSLKKSGI